MKIDLHIDLQNRVLIPGPDRLGNVSLNFMQGDTYEIVLHGWRPASDPASFALFQPASIGWHALAAGVTLIDAAPKGGAFKVKIGADTTAALAWDISRSGLAAALNALASVTAAGGLTILEDGPSHFYTVQWTVPANAVEIEFPLDGNKLTPLCIPVARSDESIAGKVNLKLVRAPVAFADAFVLPTPPVVTITRVRAGSTVRNEVQRLTVPSAAVGSFALASGKVLPVATVTAAALAESLNAQYTALDAADLRYAVTARDRGLFDIEFIGAFAQTAKDLVAVEMFDQLAIDTPTATLQFTSTAIEDMLAGEPTIAAVFEIVAADEGGAEDTIVQQACTLVNDGLAAGVGSYLASVATRTETVYVYPGEADPVAIGLLGQKFSTPAVAEDYVYTHNFNTREVEVVVLEKIADAPDQFRQVMPVEFEVDVINANQVEIYFDHEIPASPAIGSMLVWVRSLNALPFLNDHRHTTGDIDGVGARDGQTLTEIIEELFSSLPLDWPNIPASKIVGSLLWSQLGGLIPDAKLPTTVPRLNASGYLELSSIPLSVPRIDSETGSLVYSVLNTETGQLEKRVLVGSDGLFAADRIGDLSRIPGFSDAVKKVLSGDAANDLALAFALPSFLELYPGRAPAPTSDVIDAAALPKPGGLLPAIHDATIANLTIPLPAAGATYADNVFLNASGSDIALPGGMGRRGSTLKAGAHAACDGRLWYRVAQEGSTTSYHPMDFDRELVMLDVNDSMFPVGSVFALQIDFETQILRSETRAQWVCIVEIGAFDAVASPAGKNISGITWGATPVITCPIHLTQIRTPHTFGIRFTRAADEDSVPVITGETKLYRGAWTTTETVPAGPGFAIRARLARFDTEDSLSDPRGYVFLAFNPNKKSLATIV